MRPSRAIGVADKNLLVLLTRTFGVLMNAFSVADNCFFVLLDAMKD